MNLKQAIIKHVLFDSDKQLMFLTILSAQAKVGRPLQDIFKSLSTSSNKYFRALAALSLNPNSPYFASHYGAYFNEKTAKLLVLSQKFNAVPDFIDHTLNSTDRKSLSGFWTVFVPGIQELVLMLFLLLGFAGIYVYNPLIAESFVDLSDTFAYAIGGLLVTYFPLFSLLAAAGAGVYQYTKTRPVPVREKLKKTLGVFKHYDARFAIELFRIMSIMTQGIGGKDVSIKTIVSELSSVYGHTKYRNHQFSVIRRELAKGAKFSSALDAAGILDKDSLDLFRGLAPYENIPEITKASRAVADLLASKTKAEMKFVSKNYIFGLYLILAISFIAFIELTLGGGLNAIQ